MIKSSSDCVIITVNSIIECPVCGEDITKKNISNSCKKNIEGHSVCVKCYNRLTETYYKNGIGCLYCGDPKTKIINQNITEVPGPIPLINEHLVIIERNNRGGVTWVCNCDVGCDVVCISLCSAITILMAVGALFIMCNVMFSLGQMFLHWINGENHIHQSELTLTNAVYGFFGILLVAYIVFQIYLLCNVCYTKMYLGYCDKYIKYFKLNKCYNLCYLTQRNSSSRNQHHSRQVEITSR